ncbi:Leukotoxin export ATP-binding protein LtxB [Frankliniella fusca]|uniref:Leukotoxin export ATP-binding protein LtxB n=1 Tax=Frankliniella fusca TaxID=407009 RepID=A0AAE1HX41_9NEOP|nr:Leukotoxin export ATP-binding protein LtxB [Frankliniella fusca]KAK3929412.1 Leukotoxin export ATP-binding protein LtxB [Frankliniella fusca]
MEMEMHQHFGCSAIMSPSGCCSVKYGLVCHTYQFLATNYFDKKVAQILCTLNNVKVKANKENQGCELLDEAIAITHLWCELFRALSFRRKCVKTGMCCLGMSSLIVLQENLVLVKHAYQNESGNSLAIRSILSQEACY